MSNTMHPEGSPDSHPELCGVCLRLAAAVCDTVPGQPMVGIASIEGGILYAAVASSHRAHLLEEVQLVHLRSPGHDVAAHRRPVLVADLALESQWDAAYRDEMLMLGVRSLYCHPLIPDTDTDTDIEGVVTLYAEHPGTFPVCTGDRLAPFLSTAAGTLHRIHAHRPRQDDWSPLHSIGGGIAF
ncbi:hypothetical protein [Nocardia wallacei]|uniref:GAF domain-containing protein n=1 Tax=Nocardia wallacei TaxID=480035 RepID=A0A7G1KL40_9NOCA|nr:hypothetical protein [Nocardia wallacei]BCK54044.1 hypothetical protein NWFMUON74_18160 [Nocardia wallacei]